eukprot:COSAG04_NODE_27936_length_279_cov_0.538889_1_plen_30_part_01
MQHITKHPTAIAERAIAVPHLDLGCDFRIA